MNEVYVLDASAILCFMYSERGGDRVSELLENAIVSSVNYAEVLTKMHDRGFSDSEFAAALAEFRPPVIEFSQEQAFTAAALRNVTRSKGLSLGDRACLALAISRNAIAVTTDRAWNDFENITRVMLVR